MYQYTFFYDGGAEGDLSALIIEATDYDSAWDEWSENMDNMNLTVRLVIENLNQDQVLFQE